VGGETSDFQIINQEQRLAANKQWSVVSGQWSALDVRLLLGPRASRPLLPTATAGVRGPRRGSPAAVLVPARI